MRKIASVAAAGILGVLILAGPGAAQPQYPPLAATISLSDATISCPAPFVISGQGFGPNERVTITFDGQTIGSATANTRGEFSAQVTAPAAAVGGHTVTASNSESASARLACVAAAAVPPGAREAAPALAVTGGNITVGLLMLAGLLAAGAAALLVGRRRSRASS